MDPRNLYFFILFVPQPKMKNNAENISDIFIFRSLYYANNNDLMKVFATGFDMLEVRSLILFVESWLLYLPSNALNLSHPQ
jgi:hypothetical protein